MNPLLLALGQWAITGLPELIAALNAAAPPATTPAPTVTVTTTTPAPAPATGWPPPLPPETPAPTAKATGGSDGIRALQAVLGVPEDGYWGPTTRAALIADVAAIKAKLGV